MNLEDFEVIKVPNEECFFSLLQECGPGGFYHNRTTLLKKVPVITARRLEKSSHGNISCPDVTVGQFSYESVKNAIRNEVIVLYTLTLFDLSVRTPHYGVKRNGKPVRWIRRPSVDSSIR